MLGDEAQPAESDGSRNRATSGPRHAAPRKSLLTKLHVPAGKAVALAAMPTAVLMGMGFTPHLAQADEMPKNPFKAGPCVSQSDTPTPSSTDKATTGKSADKPADTSGTSTGKTASPKPTASPSPSGSTDTPKPDPSTTTAPQPDPKSAPTTAPSATPSPTASPKKSVNPLDPLGLGDVLKGLLGGNTSTPTTKAPDPAPSTATPKPSASPSAGTTAKAPAADPLSTAGKTVKDTVDGVTGAAKKAVKGAQDATGSTVAPKATTTAPSGSSGPQAYPCPSYDAKALAAAKTESGIPLLPDAPWTLKSSMLTLHGLAYDGIVQVRTWNGTVKDVLKFTASGVDIKDLFQSVEGPQGGHTFVKARSGSTSTIRNGTVTMYTESLSGNLLGLIPITFTPKAPPPLTLPELFFTNVTVIQAGQFGGDLHVPGMQVLPNQP
ncbi:hydrogenase expression protein HypF [Streptomyces sp. NPDC051976]|uniref:hydrogenase expression protein HypF n=1 Tax=Streptomyces sp. NPDC051976 TaxID=3154947 RepID=UPI003440BF72